MKEQYILIVSVATNAIVPILVWWLTLQQEAIKDRNKELSLLRRDVNDALEKIRNIRETLKHRSDIAQLKYGILKDCIDDIQMYLEKINGYKRRHSNASLDSKVTTLTDVPDTGIF